jgi:hypothetical protein
MRRANRPHACPLAGPAFRLPWRVGQSVLIRLGCRDRTSPRERDCVEVRWEAINCRALRRFGLILQ